MKLLFRLIVLMFILYSCGQQDKSRVTISLHSQEEKSGDKNIPRPDTGNLVVAISAMISPQVTIRYYDDLLYYLGNKTGIKISLKQRRTYEEVNKLLAESKVDLAFICSGALVRDELAGKVKLLAVPVVNGEPYYQAFVIVNNNSDFHKFEDLKGHSFAYTDPLSNTGRLFALKLINETGLSESEFFSKTIYTYAHDNSISMVSKGLVDGATIDGLIYNYFLHFSPEKVINLRIIEKSEKFGIPPIVVPADLDSTLIRKLKNVLLNMHWDDEGKVILNNLLIDKFQEGNPADYIGIKTMLHSINR